MSPETPVFHTEVTVIILETILGSDRIPDQSTDPYPRHNREQT